MLTRMKKGFTLLELIVVIVVLGILAALAVPSFSTVKTNAAKAVATRVAEGIVRDAQAAAAFNGDALDGTYVEAAGKELGAVIGETDHYGTAASYYDVSDHAVTVTNAGVTATVTINTSTGAIA